MTHEQVWEALQELDRIASKMADAADQMQQAAQKNEQAAAAMNRAANNIPSRIWVQ